MYVVPVMICRSHVIGAINNDDYCGYHIVNNKMNRK